VLPGLRAFKWLDFTVAIDDPDCTVTGRLVLEGFRGPYRLTRFTVEAGLGMWPSAITGEALRTVSIEEVVSLVLADHGTEMGKGGAGLELAPLSGTQLRAIGTGNDDVLALVAAVYLAALLSGGNPAEAVAARLGASAATAGRFIWAAKRRGQIRPTDRSI
jgi:hypothetical protein